MQLAKPALDIGLFTNDIDALLPFWREQIGVGESELLKLGGGVHQYRHAIGDSVLKINHCREPVPRARPCASGMWQLSLLYVTRTATGSKSASVNRSPALWTDHSNTRHKKTPGLLSTGAVKLR